ncbi:MAG: hypothetical protein DRO40_07085 [Thermoprotei archaeon]|nr:MAG: hypothetical protein DRO40_07085 [Thermoprotei archaeon]
MLANDKISSVIKRAKEGTLKNRLNLFYEGIEREIRTSITQGNLRDLNFLLSIRKFPLLATTLLFETEKVDLSELDFIRVAALIAHLPKYRNLIINTFSLQESLIEKYVKECKNIINELKGKAGASYESKAFKLQIFEVAFKRLLIEKTGAFMNYRGASAFIDIATRTAAERVKELLGSEFIIASAAGEVIYLSPLSISRTIEEELLKYVTDNLHLPFGELLIYRGSAKITEPVSVKDLENSFGELYVASISSALELNLKTDRLKVDLRDLCRSCRNDLSANPNYLSNVLEKFFPKNVARSYVDVILDYMSREYGRVTCKSCIASFFYSYLIFKVVNQWEKCTDIERKLAERSSAVRILKEIRNRYLNYKYIKDLNEYDYDEGRRALIAVCYGDGDSFGKIKASAKSIEDFIFISCVFEECIKKGIMKGLAKAIETDEEFTGPSQSATLPVTPLYYGGDDLLLVIRAELIPSFIEGFCIGFNDVISKLDRAGLLKRITDERLGVSFGFAIGKTNAPGHILIDLSIETLKFTKSIIKSSNLKERYGVQASIIYSKTTPDRKFLSEIIGRYEPEEHWRTLINALIRYSDKLNFDKCSLIRALRSALLDEDEYVSGYVSATDLREYLESMVMGENPYMTVLRMMYDTSRIISSSKSKEEITKGYRLKDIIANFLNNTELNEASLYWLYVLISFLDIFKDRVDGEGKNNSLLKVFIGGKAL